MARAIAPTAVPELPDRAIGWARSTRRADSMFHAHAIGFPVCGARLYLDRFNCEETSELGKMRYHGICPRCYNLATKENRK